MSCGAELQLAASRQIEVLVGPAPLQLNSSALHSYQRQQQQHPHRHQPNNNNQHHHNEQQQRHQLQQTRQQQQLLLRQHQLSQQSPEAAAATNTTTANNNRLAAVQSKRKEKARIAARARRSQEASIIMEMAGELCISQEKLRRIDKATIVKLAIDYIRAHGVLCNGAPSLCSHSKQLKNSHHNEHINEQPQLITQHNYDGEFDGEIQQRPERQKRQLHGVETAEALAVVGGEQEQQQQQQRQEPLYSAPKLSTTSIFAPRTVDNMNPHFLMIEEKDNGKGAFVLKPDTEILDEDDLTHLAPQAGDISISLEVEPLEGIPLEDLLIPSPASYQQQLWMR